MVSSLPGRRTQRHAAHRHLSSSLTLNPKQAKSSSCQLVRLQHDVKRSTPSRRWYICTIAVEDSMMDVYDLVYEEVRRNTSSFRRHELTAIHEAVSCLSALAETLAAAVLQGVSLSSQDCLQEIQDFLKKHMDFVSTILGVYGMILTSFLWFSIHFSNNLDRKGKYILRESSWCRRRSEVTHKIPREGAAWGRQWDVCLVFPLPALRAVVCFQAGQSGRLCHC
uniref:Tetraspanin 32 n=1 Tax=Otus sunia TaxID=257818 RepID=A0A8C8AML7_9STRI